MTSTNQSFAASSTTYLDSLVKYVLDIKPYHSKLAQGGAVSEKYLFSDAIKIGITENESMRVFLGADLLPSAAIPGSNRARLSQSWWHDIISDGYRSTWPMPQISNPLFASSARQQNFVCGVNDYTGIPGITTGAFNPQRWDGPGITDVRKNNVHQQDTIDYTLCHGAYVFDVIAGGNWKEHDISDITAFAASSGALQYDDVARAGGTIRAINGGNYEEWVITTTFVDTVGTLPATASVVGSASGNIGTVTFGQPFSSPQINFLWAPAPHESSETTRLIKINGFINGNILTVTSVTSGNIQGITPGLAVSGANVISGTSVTNVGPVVNGFQTYYLNVFQNVSITTPLVLSDTWTLTPLAKITTSPSTPQETWSIIKSNPIGISSKPVFFPATPRTDTPALEVHARSLDHTSEEVTWTVTFNGDGTYDLSRSAINPGVVQYPITIDLINGCSFKNADIAFTILPTVHGWSAGDNFTWTTATSSANFKVYGTLSGWAEDATVGKWYWNGKIGFKIPSLQYFTATLSSTIATSVAGVEGSWFSEEQSSQVLTSITFQNGAFYAAGNDSIVAASADGVNWTSDVASIFAPPPLSKEMLVVTGEKGLVAITTDGIIWGIQQTGVTYDLKASTQIPHFLASPSSGVNDLSCTIVVGDHGTIITSSNAVAWAAQTSGTIYNLNDVTWTNPAVIPSPDTRAIIVVGDHGTILHSTDRIIWTEIPSGTTENLNAVIYEPSLDVLIIVGNGGVILRSLDHGLSWANLHQFSDGNLRAVAYGDSEFVAVGPDGWTARSADGISWTRYSGRAFNSIAYGDGKFVAVGGTASQYTKFTPKGPISSMAESSIYTVTFTTASTAAEITGTILGTVLTVTAISAGTLIESQNLIGVGISIGTQLGQQLTGFVNGVGGGIGTYAVNISQNVASTTINAASPGYATVFNNRYGYGPGLITGQQWSDEFCSFQLDTISSNIQYNIGDQVQVFISPPFTYAGAADYEGFPYELAQYDAGNIDLTVPYLFDTDLFPMYQSHGAVIWHGDVGTLNGNCINGDALVIDKAFYQNIQLKITNASSSYPELGAVNDWVPLELRYYDNATGTAPLLTPTSNADFSDLATYIEAYSAANPDQLVFSILSPRFMKTNRTAVSTLTFDPTFFSTYLPFNASYSLKMTPDESYGQHIRVKVTENLKIYGRINLDISDPIMVVVVDGNAGFIEIVAEIFPVDLINVSIAEGGALPVFGYDELSYGIEEYDVGFPNGVITGVTETSPGVYNWTGNPSDWVMPYPTTSPSFYITDNVGAGVPAFGSTQQPTGETGVAIIGDSMSIQEIHAASFVGSINGNILTVSSMITGTIELGQTLKFYRTNVPILSGGNSITAFQSGSGGVGTYTVEFSQNLASTFITGSDDYVFLCDVVFDFNLIEQTTWAGNPPENEGLLISTAATLYEVTAINLPFDPTTHFPTFIVESVSNLGTYGNPIPSLVFTPMAGATSASYTFTLPSGFTAPFRLWIV